MVLVCLDTKLVSSLDCSLLSQLPLDHRARARPVRGCGDGPSEASLAFAEQILGCPKVTVVRVSHLDPCLTRGWRQDLSSDLSEWLTGLGEWSHAWRQLCIARGTGLPSRAPSDVSFW